MRSAPPREVFRAPERHPPAVPHQAAAPARASSRGARSSRATHHTCQYCGARTHDLTLDHVVPRHRGGRHSWDNLVAACKPCNHRKGGKTLDEARLRLLRTPIEPRSDLYSLFTPYLADPRNEAWRDVPLPGPRLSVARWRPSRATSGRPREAPLRHRRFPAT